MKNCGSSMDKALRKYAGQNCHKILYIDITEDRFEVLTVDEYEWEIKNKEQPSCKISDWFKWFADGPLCHEEDRERFREFTDLCHLKERFERTNCEAAGIVFRRRFDPSARIFSLASMELLPEVTEEGHIAAFLFVKSITSEIEKYNEILEEGTEAKDLKVGKRTILVVEDNEMNREILTEMLSDEYEILQAENGAVGLELLQDHMAEISVVILDVQMPVMNGYEFLEAVQKDIFLSKVPVLVATGSNGIEEERRCLRLGAVDFVAKPYNRDIIMCRVAGIIRLRESAATMSVLQTDERTGLYTLQAFYYYARQAMDKHPDIRYTITIFDVNNFKIINDSYGEMVGDRILQRIAKIVKEYTAASDVNGRFGAARFLLLRETISEEETDTWIRDLFQALQESCEIKGISFKAGVYEDVDKTLSVSGICDRAIVALNSIGHSFESKYTRYDRSHAEKERRLAQMEADMQDAYDSEQFSVYYQPKHDAQTGQLVGAEALIRWIHPTYGFLSPAEFIPLFERNGFISFADYYVLKKTCNNIRSWNAEGITSVPISVNFSKKDFERENFLSVIRKPINEYEVDPKQIHIEVTESIFSDRVDELANVLEECRRAGFEIELDDFGTGYSSLNTLAMLPLDVVKLDMVFMKNFEDERKKKVLMTCIQLAKNLGLKTVAEGVETEEQLLQLKQFGCDWVQGYYYSKPLPEAEFRDYLIRNM